MTDERMVVELHSEECRCHGYGWSARRQGQLLRSACCRDGNTAPDGAVWVDSERWLELGMPRTAEQYHRVEGGHGGVPAEKVPAV
jgi:hypothetical protein